MYSERVLGNEAMGADGKRSPGKWGNLSPEQRCELAKKAVERVNRGKGWVINNPGDQGQGGQRTKGLFCCGAQETLTWFPVRAVPRQRVQRNSGGVLPRGSDIPVPGGHPQTSLTFCKAWLLTWGGSEGQRGI